MEEAPLLNAGVLTGLARRARGVPRWQREALHQRSKHHRHGGDRRRGDARRGQARAARRVSRRQGRGAHRLGPHEGRRRLRRRRGPRAGARRLRGRGHAHGRGVRRDLRVAEPEPASWATALREGIRRIQQYGGASEGDRTMLDALLPAVSSLEAGEGLAGAAAAARRGLSGEPARARTMWRLERYPPIRLRTSSSRVARTCAIVLLRRRVFVAAKGERGSAPSRAASSRARARTSAAGTTASR